MAVLPLAGLSDICLYLHLEVLPPEAEMGIDVEEALTQSHEEGNVQGRHSG